MLFSEPSFLFFLPTVLLAYFGLGPRLRNWVLTAASLLFYVWGERVYVIALLASIVLNWGAAQFVVGGRDVHRSRAAVVLTIAANLLMLGVFKYAAFVTGNANTLMNALGLAAFDVPPIHLPIGISFFVFQGMSYVVDVYRGDVAPQPSLLKMAMYTSFFPQLIAGPIVRYVDVQAQLATRTVTRDDFADGARRFVLGLGKKMIVANVAARVADGVFALPATGLDAALAWIGIAAYTIQIYFDFSGYSDMAIGLARLFGFRFLENFNYPYVATSLTDFWRRWHISLSTWFRDYLYIPLGGNRVSKGRRYINLMTVFALCGLWHGASWNFAIWGVFHGAFLVIERLRVVDPLRSSFRPLQHAYVLMVVMIGWVFFRAETLPQALQHLTAMAGLADPIHAPGIAMFIDNEALVVGVLGVLGSTPILPWLGTRADALKARSPALEVALESGQLLGMCILFMYAQMLMAAGSYSPFIYFRF